VLFRPLPFPEPETLLGSDPGVIGRTVSLNGTPYQVIGVMPASFQFSSRDVQLWTPLSRVAQLRVLGALAAIALLLAGVGIHDLLAFTVAQRSKEIGVRLALGAEPRSVARIIISDAARLAALGIVPGALAAYAAARAMSALLFGVPPSDAVTMVACISLGFLVTLSGSLVPALRAMRLSPIIAMRSE
jgi:ABC-type antimicrobial peptide transport system permease subunit